MAFSSNEQCGYDVTFVTEPGEIYQCIACHLVLRDPQLIVKCGHRYCKACFEKFKDYSIQMGIEVKCPIDRDIVELDKVSPLPSLMVGGVNYRFFDFLPSISIN